MVGRKTVHIGSFADLELAGLVAAEARKKISWRVCKIKLGLLGVCSDLRAVCDVSEYGYLKEGWDGGKEILY